MGNKLTLGESGGCQLGIKALGSVWLYVDYAQERFFYSAVIPASSVSAGSVKDFKWKMFRIAPAFWFTLRMFWVG